MTMFAVAKEKERPSFLVGVLQYVLTGVVVVFYFTGCENIMSLAFFSPGVVLSLLGGVCDFSAFVFLFLPCCGRIFPKRVNMPVVD